MSKLTFKRIALVLVSALSFGALSSAPSNASPVSNSDTLTVGATATAVVGETASVTISMGFIGADAGDSLVVNVVNQSAPAAATTAIKHGLYITESANVSIHTDAQTCATGIPATNTLASANCAPGFQKDYGPRGTTGGAAGDNYNNAVQAFVGVTAATTAASASFSWRLMAPNVAGTYVYRVYLSAGTGTTYTAFNSTAQTITVTVTANTSSVASATYSTAWLNRAAEFTSRSVGIVDPSANGAAVGLESDSALVVSAGNAATASSAGSAIAILTPVVRNASDTKVATVQTIGGDIDNLRVKDSVTVVMSGPGLLAVSSYYGVVSTSRQKQVSMNWNESVVVYADGTAGVGTITSYIGGSVTNAGKLAQAAKTITFVGRATTFEVSAGDAGVRAGGNILYNGATTATNGGDSVTAGTAVVRFIAKDAAGNAVTVNTLSTDPGDAGGAGFWAISSDTSVIAAGGGTTNRRSPALACEYTASATTSYAAGGYWYCNGNVYDSGTVTLTIVDSRTVTPNGANYLTTTTSAVYKSSELSITFSGSGYTGTMALDKATYNVGEGATLTSTCKDTNGRNVQDGNSNVGCFSNLNWASAAPTFTPNNSVNAAGGKFGTGATPDNLITYFTKTSGGVSWLRGTDTALIYMPTTAGTYTLNGRTSGATTDSVLLTFKVVDPSQAAQDAAIAASQAAADAATDAALEAIDAANAATDAANLAAEAADAATVAAEEARDAADAATAAVEALATEVATLMAALKAQITTLARTVAKIAKKVNA